MASIGALKCDSCGSFAPSSGTGASTPVRVSGNRLHHDNSTLADLTVGAPCGFCHSGTYFKAPPSRVIGICSGTPRGVGNGSTPPQQQGVSVPRYFGAPNLTPDTRETPLSGRPQSTPGVGGSPAQSNPSIGGTAARDATLYQRMHEFPYSSPQAPFPPYSQQYGVGGVGVGVSGGGQTPPPEDPLALASRDSDLERARHTALHQEQLRNVLAAQKRLQESPIALKLFGGAPLQNMQMPVPLRSSSGASAGTNGSGGGDHVEHTAVMQSIYSHQDSFQYRQQERIAALEHQIEVLQRSGSTPAEDPSAKKGKRKEEDQNDNKKKRAAEVRARKKAAANSPSRDSLQGRVQQVKVALMLAKTNMIDRLAKSFFHKWMIWTAHKMGGGLSLIATTGDGAEEQRLRQQVSRLTVLNDDQTEVIKALYNHMALQGVISGTTGTSPVGVGQTSGGGSIPQVSGVFAGGNEVESPRPPSPAPNTALVPEQAKAVKSASSGQRHQDPVKNAEAEVWWTPSLQEQVGQAETTFEVFNIEPPQAHPEAAVRQGQEAQTPNQQQQQQDQGVQQDAETIAMQRQFEAEDVAYIAHILEAEPNGFTQIASQWNKPGDHKGWNLWESGRNDEATIGDTSIPFGKVGEAVYTTSAEIQRYTDFDEDRQRLGDCTDVNRATLVTSFKVLWCRKSLKTGAPTLADFTTLEKPPEKPLSVTLRQVLGVAGVHLGPLVLPPRLQRLQRMQRQQLQEYQRDHWAEAMQYDDSFAPWAGSPTLQSKSMGRLVAGFDSNAQIDDAGSPPGVALLSPTTIGSSASIEVDVAPTSVEVGTRWRLQCHDHTGPPQMVMSRSPSASPGNMSSMRAASSRHLMARSASSMLLGSPSGTAVAGACPAALVIENEMAAALRSTSVLDWRTPLHRLPLITSSEWLHPMEKVKWHLAPKPTAPTTPGVEVTDLTSSGENPFEVTWCYFSVEVERETTVSVNYPRNSYNSAVVSAASPRPGLAPDGASKLQPPQLPSRSQIVAQRLKLVRDSVDDPNRAQRLNEEPLQLTADHSPEREVDANDQVEITVSPASTTTPASIQRGRRETQRPNSSSVTTTGVTGQVNLLIAKEQPQRSSVTSAERMARAELKGAFHKRYESILDAHQDQEKRKASSGKVETIDSLLSDQMIPMVPVATTGTTSATTKPHAAVPLAGALTQPSTSGYQMQRPREQLLPQAPKKKTARSGVVVSREDLTTPLAMEHSFAITREETKARKLLAQDQLDWLMLAVDDLADTYSRERAMQKHIQQRSRELGTVSTSDPRVQEYFLQESHSRHQLEQSQLGDRRGLQDQKLAGHILLKATTLNAEAASQLASEEEAQRQRLRQYELDDGRSLREGMVEMAERFSVAHVQYQSGVYDSGPGERMNSEDVASLLNTGNSLSAVPYVLSPHASNNTLKESTATTPSSSSTHLGVNSALRTGGSPASSPRGKTNARVGFHNTSLPNDQAGLQGIPYRGILHLQSTACASLMSDEGAEWGRILHSAEASLANVQMLTLEFEQSAAVSRQETQLRKKIMENQLEELLEMVAFVSGVDPASL